MSQVERQDTLTPPPVDTPIVPALAANPSAISVVDPQPESGLDLFDLMRQVAEESPGLDPAAIAAAVVSHVPTEQVEACLLQAVSALCRQRFAPRAEHSPRPAPARAPEPVEVTPTLGVARKVSAAEALNALPARLQDRVNVGTVKVPVWKTLAECTAGDLVDAIEVRRDLARAHGMAADFYVVLLDEMVETHAARVADLLRQRRAG